MAFVLGIDQGTTGSTAVLVSENGDVIGKSTKEFPQHFPHDGWVEHQLDEIWQSVADAVDEAMRQGRVNPKDCAVIGITNQRETVVGWQGSQAEPIHPAIVWQDRRTAAMCENLLAAGYEPMIQKKTGLILDPYFSATKMAWLLEHSAAKAKGNLRLGTIDSYLTFRMTGGETHVSDVSNASRTALFNLHELKWDPELLHLFGIHAAMLPNVLPNNTIVGKTKGLSFLPDGIPIGALIGDQQAALYGQQCHHAGDIKCTYGTGAFLMVNTGTQAVPSSHRLLTTVAWQLEGQAPQYALEGSTFIAGAAVQWLRDGLGLINDASEIEALATQVNETQVTFVPALTGLGAPYWKPDARGLIDGVDRATTRADLARAALEGIAMQITDVFEAMQKDMAQNAPEVRVQRMKVDGGASVNRTLMQMQADFANVEVEKPSVTEATAIGAARLAASAIDLSIPWAASTLAHYRPNMPSARREAHRSKWAIAVAKAQQPRTYDDRNTRSTP